MQAQRASTDLIKDRYDLNEVVAERLIEPNTITHYFFDRSRLSENLQILSLGKFLVSCL